VKSGSHQVGPAPWVTSALAILLLVTPEAALGQDVGQAQAFFVSGSSDTPAFESYSGFGVATAFAARGVFWIRAVFDTESTALMREGWVCNEVGRACEFETGILDETRRENVSFSLQAVLNLSDRVRLSAAAGPHFSNLRWESTSVSQRTGEAPPVCSGPVENRNCIPRRGRSPLIENQKRIRIGAVLGGEVLLRPLTALPFVISAGWDRKVVKMTGCVSSESARAYAPFCGWGHSNEWRLGVGVVF